MPSMPCGPCHGGRPVHCSCHDGRRGTAAFRVSSGKMRLSHDEWGLRQAYDDVSNPPTTWRNFNVWVPRSAGLLRSFHFLGGLGLHLGLAGIKIDKTVGR
jgi:hypothetical protein